MMSSPSTTRALAEGTRLPPLRALAMLPPISEARVHAAICPPGHISVRLVPEQFVDAVERGWPDIAVIDPILTGGNGSIPAALRTAHTPALLYVCLTPEYARAAVEFLRSMPLPVITYGYGDDARALTAALARSGRASRGALLLEQLTPVLERLPRHIRRGIVDANQSHTRLTTAAELASYCGVHRATLARALADAGLRSASHLLAALGLVQEYDALSNVDIPLTVIAHRLGLGSIRALLRRTLTASGYTAAQVRRGLPFTQFCAACAARLADGA